METDERILKAARTVFIRKGMDGARMQEIAAEAGINKALLHYYFRSKEKLYHAVVKEIFRKAFPDVMDLMVSPMPVEQRIRAFIEKYSDILQENPFLPAFMLREIHRDPETLVRMISAGGIDVTVICNVLEKEMDAGRIKKGDPRELMLNIVSLTVFPYAMAPMASVLLFGGDPSVYRNFLLLRKKSVPDFILQAISVS